MKRVLMISTDRKAFEVGSAVRQRLVEYANLTAGLDVIIFSKKQQGFRLVSVNEKLNLYPTNSRWRLGYLIGAYFLGRRLVRPDIITCQDPFETGLVGWLLSRKFKTLLELQVHTDVFSLGFKRESAINKVRVSLARYLLPKANQVRVVSKRIAESFNQDKIILQKEPIVLPIFVESEEGNTGGVDLYQAYPQFNKIVLITSRFTKEKQLSLALKAFGLVAQDMPNIGLVLAGAGPLLDELKLLARKLKIADKVIFTGWVSNPKSLYRSADCLVLTSAYEGYGLSLVEAAMAKLPIVSTDVGIAKEVGATIIEPIPTAIAGGIKDQLSNPIIPANTLPIVSKSEYLAVLARAWQ